jgi:hypothetical protein
MHVTEEFTYYMSPTRGLCHGVVEELAGEVATSGKVRMMQGPGGRRAASAGSRRDGEGGRRQPCSGMAEMLAGERPDAVESAEAARRSLTHG